MICENTFSSGFWFWVGRATADVVIWGGVSIAIVCAALLLHRYLNRTPKVK